MTDFKKELENLLNYHSKENGSNTPDFILAEFLLGCLESFDKSVSKRDNWYAPEEGRIKEKHANGGMGEDPIDSPSIAKTLKRR